MSRRAPECEGFMVRRVDGDEPVVHDVLLPLFGGFELHVDRVDGDAVVTFELCEKFRLPRVEVLFPNRQFEKPLVVQNYFWSFWRLVGPLFRG